MKLGPVLVATLALVACGDNHDAGSIDAPGGGNIDARNGCCVGIVN